jgi:hypothetical protein
MEKLRKSLLERVTRLLEIPECKENFIPELQQKLDYYERTQCNEESEDSDDEANKEYISRTVPPTGAIRRGGANKSVHKKLKRKSKKTRKVKRFPSRRNKK